MAGGVCTIVLSRDKAGIAGGAESGSTGTLRGSLWQSAAVRLLPMLKAIVNIHVDHSDPSLHMQIFASYLRTPAD